MNIRALLALAGSAVLFFSCNSKDAFVQQPIEGGEDQRGLLTLGSEGSELSMSHMGEVYDEIYLTADEAWQVQGLPSWVQLSDADKPSAELGHAGTTRISVQVQPNLSESARNVSFLFTGTATGKTLAVLTIKQGKIIFEIEDGADRVPFEWYNFQVKEDGKPAKNQPSAKSLVLKSNIDWDMEAPDGFDAIFDHQLEKTADGARLVLLPLEPCLAEEDIVETISFVPRFTGISLSSDEWEEVNSYWTRNITVSQTHFNFVVKWVEADVPDDGPVFPELGNALSPRTYSFTVKSDASWSLSGASDWLLVTGPDGKTVSGEIKGSGEPFTVDVRAGFANPSAEPRPFSILLSPTLPKDILDLLPQEQIDGLGKTISGFQKGLAFRVSDIKGGEPMDVCTHEFPNEDVGRVEGEKFVVYVKTPCAFDDFCDFYPGENPWFDWSIEPSAGTFPADSTYRMTFYVTEQNLEFEDISTPKASANYQGGYAYFNAMAHAPAKGTPCNLSPKASMFASGAAVPQVPFVFSQGSYILDIDWPAALLGLMPFSTATTDVNVSSSGRWTCEVEYDPGSNENPEMRGWVGGLPGDVMSGNRVLRVGSTEGNYYDHSRQATVTFKSVNHSEAGKTSISGWKKTFDIIQNEFRLIVRRHGEEDPETGDLGVLPAYETPDDDCYFFLECGGPWEMTKKPDFVVNVPTEWNDSQGYKGVLEFDLLPNLTPAARGGEIEISAILPAEIASSDRKRTVTVKLSQDPFVFSVQRVMSEIEAYNAEPVNICDINITRGAEWYIMDNLGNKYLPDALASGNAEHYAFIPAHNLGSSSRNMVFTFVVTAPSGLDNRTVSCTQKPFRFDFGRTSVKFSELPDDSETLNLNVSSSGPWALKGKVPAGFHYEATGNNASDGILRLWADNNLAPTKRSGSIVLESLAHKEAGQKKEWTIDLSQDPFIWDVIADTYSYSFPAVPNAGDIIALTVNCSSRWRVRLMRGSADEPFKDNIEIVKEPGIHNGYYNGNKAGLQSFSLSVKPLENLEPGNPKTLTLRLESEFYDGFNDLFEDISITQDPFNWVVTAQPNYEWGALSTGEVKFDVTSAGDWALRNAANGVAIKSGGKVEGWTFTWNTPVHDKATTVTIKASPVYKRTPTQLNLQLVSLPHEAKGRTDGHESIILTQGKYDFFWNDGEDVAKLDRATTFGPLENAARQIPVTCTSDWSVSDMPSWIHATKTADGKAVNITADHNTSTASWSQRRAGVVTLASHGLELKLNVDQDPYVFSVDKVSVNIDPQGLTYEDVTVVCSGGYEVAPQAGWVKIDGYPGVRSYEGSAVVSLSAEEDASGSKGRSTTVNFVSDDVSGLVYSVTLNQMPYVLQFAGAAQSSYYFSPDAGMQFSLNVDATVSWNTQRPAWLTVSPSSKTIEVGQNATISTPVTFRASQNNTGRTRRSGEVSLYTTLDTGTPVAVIPVYQDAFLVEGSPEQFNAVDGSARSVTVYSSNEWEIDKNSTAGWLDFDRMEVTSGTGVNNETGEAVTIYATNNEGNSRNGNLVFLNKEYSGLKRIVPVSQKAFVWNVAPSGKTTFASLVGADDQLSLGVTTSGEYETTVDPEGALEWLSITDGSGTDAGTVVVKAIQDNFPREARSATVTVSHKIFTGRKTSFTVTQEGFVFDVSGRGTKLSGGETLYYSVNGESIGIQVKSTGEWNIEGIPDWLATGDATSGGAGTHVINLVADGNETDALREATLTVVSAVVPAYNISFNLAQDVFRLANNNFSEFEELSAGPKSFSVFATGDWSVSPKADWVHVNPVNGSGNGDVEVSVDDNLTTSARQAEIWVSSTPLGSTGGFANVFTVKQKAYVLSASQSEFVFEPDDTDGTSFTVTSSGDWTVEGDPGWSVISPASGGPGETLVTVSPTFVHVSATPVQGSYTIKGTIPGAPSLEISLTQLNAYLGLTSDVLYFSATESGAQKLTVTATHDWVIGPVATESEMPAWVHLSTLSGQSGDTEVEITVDDWDGSGKRQATLYVDVPRFNGAASRFLYIEQAAYVPTEPEPEPEP